MLMDPSLELFIAGDMNFPDIDWSNNTVKDDPQYGVLVNQKFLNIVDDRSLTQLVSFPTRQASVFDLIVLLAIQIWWAT